MSGCAVKNFRQEIFSSCDFDSYEPGPLPFLPSNGEKAVLKSVIPKG
jgi:hypothetical protein